MKSLLIILSTLIFGVVGYYCEAKVNETNEVKANLFDELGKENEAKGTEHFQYQAETSRLMNLFINSMYTNREVFIRELITNGCDAIDKLRHESLENVAVTGELAKDGRVVVSIDKEAGTITFEDNGLGMTKNELKSYLGTIAKSGTAETLAKLQESKDASSLIGQFGVGFYSAFLVASKVAVASKNDKEDKQHVWIGNADSGDFVISEDPRGNTLGRGTEVVLKLKDDAKKYLDQDEVKKVMDTYASYYAYPIYLKTVKTVAEEVEEESEPEAESKEEKKEGDEEEKKDEAQVEDEEEKVKGEKKKKTIERTIIEDVQINPQKPLWMRDPKTVTHEEYVTMFKSLFKTSDDPLTYIQFKVEGDFEFRSILFVPKKPPKSDFAEKDHKNYIRLYVRRSFVTENIDNFLPPFLSFIKGVVDSDDLPLNISRETLQDTVGLQIIKAKVLSKVFEAIKNLAKNDEKKYNEFFDSYGFNFKQEILQEGQHKSKIVPLLRFKSSKSDNKYTSFDQYLERKKEGQKAIYYLAGANVKEIEKSPFIESLKARDFEVLYMIEPIDEHTVKALEKYENMEFQNAAAEGLKLSEESEEEKKAQEEKFKPLLDFAVESLKQDIDKAILSNRLVKSSCAVIASQHGWTGSMERVIMAQTSAKDNPMLQFYAMQKKIFELNPTHPVVVKLLEMVQAKENLDKVKEALALMYDSALVTSGYLVKKPKRLARNIEKLIRSTFSMSVELTEAQEKEEKEEKEENPFDFLSKEGGASDVEDNKDAKDDSDDFKMDESLEIDKAMMEEGVKEESELAEKDEL